MSLRSLHLALLCLLLVVPTVACRPDARSPGEEEPSTLVIGKSRDQGTRTFFDAGPGGFGHVMGLPLAAINERGELEGRLARSWEFSPETGSWTIHLRSDVRWHDGAPVTAHDIKFTMDLRQHPDVLIWTPGSRKSTVLDDTTFTMTYPPLFTTEEIVANTIYLPKHLLEGLAPRDYYTWDFWLHPIGNGPYRFVRHVPQTMFELEANPDFHLGRARIDRVIIKRVGASAVELLSGNVDVIFFTNPAQAKQLVEDPRFRVYHQQRLGDAFGIAWNQDRYSPFRDRRVRRALTQAIDRSELNAVLDRPDISVIFDAPMSNRQFRRGEYLDPVPYDPDVAKRLLEEAGWRDTDGDGILERDGEEFRFTILTGRWREATYVQAALRRVGIAMEIDPRSQGIPFQDPNFEAKIARWFLALRPGAIRMGSWLGPESPIGYHNPTVDSLILVAQKTRSPDKLDSIYRDLMPILQEDLPITFLFSRTDAYVAHRRVRGLSSPWRASPFTFIEQLWLEDER